MWRLGLPLAVIPVSQPSSQRPQNSGAPQKKKLRLRACARGGKVSFTTEKDRFHFGSLCITFSEGKKRVQLAAAGVPGGNTPGEVVPEIMLAAPQRWPNDDGFRFGIESACRPAPPRKVARIAPQHPLNPGSGPRVDPKVPCRALRANTTLLLYVHHNQPTLE